jgi:DNA-directed RNA polymerase I, II, and III subunit RPABC2
MSLTSTITDRFTFTGTRVTQPIMTKYERANVLGTRARQISMNFPVFVDVAGLQDEIDMALKELLAGKCPLIVRRIFPDHTPSNPHFEDWRVTELEMRSL